MVSGLVLTLDGGLGGEAGEAILEELSPLARSDRLQMVVRSSGGVGPREVGSLDKRGFHLLSPASLGSNKGGEPTPPLPAPFPEGEALGVGECLGACCRTDREDGLFTTVVEERGGPCLGVSTP